MKKIKSDWIKLVLAGTALILIYKFLNNFGDIKKSVGSFIEMLFPCLLGLAIAIFLYMPAKSLEARLARSKWQLAAKYARGISVLVLYLLIFLLCALGLVYVVPKLYHSLQELIANIPRYTRVADRYLASTGFLAGVNTEKIINSGISGYLTPGKVNEYIDMIKNIAGSLVSVFVSVVISIYILLDRDSILNYLRKIHRRVFDGRFKTVTWYLKKTITLLCSYFTGMVADALIVGVVTSLGLWALGVPYPLLIGVIIALGNLVPVFGCIVATVTAGILVFVSGGFLPLVTMLLYVVTVYVADGYFIQPKIVGKSTGVKPVVALISVIVFGNLFGIVGMALGVPAAAVIKMITDDYLNKQKTPM